MDSQVIIGGHRASFTALKEVLSEVVERAAQRESVDKASIFDNETSVAGALNRFQKKPLDESKKRVDKTRGSEEKPSILLPIKEIHDQAKNFKQQFGASGQDENRLASLGEKLSANMKADEIYEMVTKDPLYGKDPLLAKQALDFLLLLTTQPAIKGAELNKDLLQLRNEVEKAKNRFESENSNAIKWGEKFIGLDKKAAEEGLDPLATRKTTLEALEGTDLQSSYKELTQGKSLGEALKINKRVIDNLMHEINAEKSYVDGPKLQQGVHNARKLGAFIQMHRFFEDGLESTKAAIEKAGKAVIDKGNNSWHAAAA